MKIVTIPDIHGKDDWKPIVEKHINDSHIVFIGDYFDGVNTDPMEEELNFLNIIALKKQHPDKVTLLLGNHCLHYIYNHHDYLCSRYNHEYGPQWSSIFECHKALFQVAYQVDNYLFTHAGICNKWLAFVKPNLIEYGLLEDYSNMAEVLNKVNDSDEDRGNLHCVGAARGGWKSGGITWADITETAQGIPPNLHQVVGHSRVRWIETLRKIMGTTFEDRSITYTDCWDTKINYLVIDTEEKSWTVLE